MSKKLTLIILLLSICLPSILLSKELSQNDTRNIAISLVGFFNNEKEDRFDPKVVYFYGGLIDFKEVHKKLYAAFKKEKIYLRPPGEINQIINKLPKKDIEFYYEFIRKILNAMNDIALKNKNSKAFPGADFPSLVKYQGDSSKWKENDIFYLIIGLETLEYKEKDKRYLIPVMAAVKFKGNGKYLDMAIERYDFKNFNNEIMFDKIFRLIKQIK